MAQSSQRKRWVDCAVSTWSCAPGDGYDRIEWKKMVPPAAGNWSWKAFRSQSSAILRRATLSGADLRGANLIEADLSDAQLLAANCTGADLTAARLVCRSCVDAHAYPSALGERADCRKDGELAASPLDMKPLCNCSFERKRVLQLPFSSWELLLRPVLNQRKRKFP